MSNNKQPLVSIIIPVYNSERYVKETLLSCLNQTYLNLEIIVVDDGSTDNSEKIIKKIKDKRISYYKRAHSNQCKIRNYGISRAKGQLYQFLDSDDLLHSEKIEQQVNSYQIHGDDFIYSGDMFLIFGRKKTFDKRASIFNRSFSPEKYFETQFKNFGSFLTTGVWLVPSKLVNSTHGWDERAKLKNADGEYFMRIILNSSGVIYSKNSIFYYRKDVPDSIGKLFNSKEVYESWLFTYTSYAKNFQLKFTTDLANSLAWMALSIYYCNSYPNYPDLSEKCLQQIHEIGYKNPYPYGGKLFKKASQILGVNNSLILWKYLSKLKR